MNSHQIVRIINHMIIFLSFTFSISIKLVLWIWRVDFSKCSENHIKKQRDGVYIFLRRRSEELIRLFRIFMEFPEQIISRATENNCFWSFWYFFSKLFSRSSGLKPFTGYLSFVKNFLNFVNFHLFDENQYLRNFPCRVHLRNLMPAKIFFRIRLRKLILD